MSKFTDELGNFYGTNEKAWENVQWHYASRAAYLLTRSTVQDAKYTLLNGEFPSASNSSVVITGKRIAWAHAELLSLQNSFSAFERHKEIKLLKQRHKDNEKRISVIKDRRAENENMLGEIVMNAHGDKFIALDFLGRKVAESLIVYYDGEDSFEVKTSTIKSDGTVSESTPYTTKRVVLADLTPKISVQSGKNIILTTVQGRDYTRKELVSGGDLSFNVSGVIVSNILDLYPENDVKKFINIMEYGGIVQVNNIIFKQFNVDRILIKDWRLDAQECKNIQPYSFTCVAVEPDTDVVVESDTIDIINYNIENSGNEGIINVILNRKWAAGYDFSLSDILGKII